MGLIGSAIGAVGSIFGWNQGIQGHEESKT